MNRTAQVAVSMGCIQPQVHGRQAWVRAHAMRQLPPPTAGATAAAIAAAATTDAAGSRPAAPALTPGYSPVPLPSMATLKKPSSPQNELLEGRRTGKCE